MKRLVLAFILLAMGWALAGPPEGRPGQNDTRLDRFEFAIRAFEAQDRLQPPPPGCTVFVGSSTFAKWHDLEQTFSDLHAVNRGFGGSTLPEVNYYVERIVTPYRPARVVVYAGTNDIADGHGAGQVSADARTLLAHLRTTLPKADLYFISIGVAPSRLQWASTYNDANRQIQAYIEKQPHEHFIDIRPVMVDSQGQLRGDLFGPDRLHMNPQGYARWTPVLRTALQP